MISVAKRVGVCFGGPSPEHDVSILTGLQAVHALRGVSSIDEVHALFWSKNGSWFEVDGRLEASAFVNGVPDGATALQLLASPDGGFVQRKGRVASRLEPLALD